jgi:hypothetical protein
VTASLNFFNRTVYWEVGNDELSSRKSRVKAKPGDDVLRELDAIKRLLTLLLLKIDTSQGEVAMALQVDQSEVSRMFPARNVKKLKLGRST